MTERYDVVDVALSSDSADLDAILQYPLLDGTKTYTLEVSEFSCPLTAETPLPADATFAVQNTMYLLEVYVRRTGVVPGHQSTLLRTIHANLQPYESFEPNSRNTIRTPNDLVFFMQKHFNNIKAFYATQLPGIQAATHGGGDDVTADDVGADPWVTVSFTPNGTLQFDCSDVFLSHFYIKLCPFSKTLFGLTDEYISARLDGAVVRDGTTALVNTAVVPQVILGGGPGQKYRIRGDYPVTRNFEHRVMIDLDTGGMPIPAITSWTTGKSQSVRHMLASFPISGRLETAIRLDTDGATLPQVTFRCKLDQGNVVFRRAEDKVVERFQILNPRFFQNIRLAVMIERRVWKPATNAYKFDRRKILMLPGDHWSAKLRFRTLN